MIAQHLQAIQAASPLTTDAGVIAPHALLVPALVAPCRVPLPARAEFDPASAQWAQTHPDFPRFPALPCAGPVFAPRLRVAFGEQRERCTTAEALHKDAGLAPVTDRRGKQSWGHWRLQGPTCLRHTFVAWAAASPRPSFGAQVYEPPQRDKGQAHQAAVRAVACKGSRLLFRDGQDRTPSAASVYLQALKRRSAPLLHTLAQGAGKTVKTP